MNRAQRPNLSRLAPLAPLLLLVACQAAVIPAASTLPVVAPSTDATQAIPVLPAITPEAAIAVAKPGVLAFDGATIWMLSGAGEISRIDPATNSVGAPTVVAMSDSWGGFEANAAGLWKADFDANLVYRIDPKSRTLVATIPVASNPDGVGVSADAVWVAQHRGGSVTRIDPATNKTVTIVIGYPGAGGPHEIGFGDGSVWVSAGNTVTYGGPGTVVRIDLATNTIQAAIKIPANASACGGFAINDQAVWMTSCGDQPVLVRIDPSTNEVVATIDLGGYGEAAPVLIDGVPWLTVKKTEDGSDPARLVRIDPATNTIDGVFSLGDTFIGSGLVVALGSVWTTDDTNSRVLRLPLAAFQQ